MIKQVYDENITLPDSWYGKKIRAYLNAYGTKYDFCRLFGSERGGYILVYNGTMTADGDFDESELNGFINMLSPVTIEMSRGAALHIGNEYKRINKTLFKAVSGENNIDVSCVNQNTLLDNIFPILKEGFGITEYEAWYVDISHRIRHGVSDIYLYKSTTVTKVFDIDGFVFLSHIATAKSGRGQGTAGNFLHWLCGEFEKQGKSVFLYAKDERRTFYEQLGFIEADKEVFYEKDI